VTVMREIPFGLIQYPLYEKFKQNQNKKQKNSYYVHFAFCGAKAGGIAAIITTPIDVLKTRIMTFNGKSGKKAKLTLLIKRIINNEGVLILFSGIHIRFLYITLGGTVFFATNEYMKNIFKFGNFEIQLL